MIDYINQYRIEQSKKILQTEEGTIQDVSERVGFLNSNSFIRVFKSMRVSPLVNISKIVDLSNMKDEK